jgi:hypothetical protein
VLLLLPLLLAIGDFMVRKAALGSTPNQRRPGRLKSVGLNERLVSCNAMDVATLCRDFGTIKAVARARYLGLLLLRDSCTSEKRVLIWLLGMRTPPIPLITSC